jgi:hypothetical protein
LILFVKSQGPNSLVKIWLSKWVFASTTIFTTTFQKACCTQISWRWFQIKMFWREV